MSKAVEEKLDKIPVVNLIVKILKTIKLPRLEGLSLYDLLELYVIGIAEGALTTRASAIAFSFFTAIFPFLLFILIVIPYIPFEGFYKEFSAFLEASLPPSTSEFFFNNIFTNIESSQPSGLLSSVFLLSIFLMANGVNAVFSGFETSYHEQLARNVFKQYLYALGVALLLSIFLIITLGVIGYVEISLLPNILKTFNSENLIESSSTLFWIKTIKYVMLVVMIYISTATLYYFGTKEGKNSKFSSIGALFTTLLVVLTSYLFGLYIENFSQYNELYGSIGGLLILMLYLWLNANILLLGYELNASLNNLKKRQ